MILSLDVTAAHILNTTRCTKVSVNKDCGPESPRDYIALYSSPRQVYPMTAKITTMMHVRVSRFKN
jgi:hypothetical protein